MVGPPLGPTMFFAGLVSGVTYRATEPRAMGTETSQHFSPICWPSLHTCRSPTPSFNLPGCLRSQTGADLLNNTPAGTAGGSLWHWWQEAGAWRPPNSL